MRNFRRVDAVGQAQSDRVWRGSLSPLAIRTFTQQPVEDGRERPSSATGYGEGRCKGAFPQAQTRGEAPSPAPTLPSPACGGGKGGGDLSPLAGRGEGCGQMM